MLHREARHHTIGLQGEAVRLEEHLRQAFEAQKPGILNANEAEYLHVFEIDARGGIQTGARLELHAYGMQLGGSLVAPPIKAGRYRAVLTLTKLEET